MARPVGRAHHNVAVVAFANKLARIAWAVLRHGEGFDASKAFAQRPSGVSRSAT
jgi:hypothetical protein